MDNMQCIAFFIIIATALLLPPQFDNVNKKSSANEPNGKGHSFVSLTVKDDEFFCFKIQQEHRWMI